MAIEPERANVGLIAGENEAMLIDTGSCPEQGAAILASANAFLNVPVSHVVITHAHDDHWLGLAGMPGLTSYGQEGLGEIATAGAVLPQRLFAQADVVDLGNRYVEMLHTGPAHSSVDVWVNVADARVLFAGDLVEEGADPYFEDDSEIDGWAKTLDMLVQSTRPDAVIVPGHGMPVNQDFVGEMAAKMHSVVGQTKMLIQGGTKREGVEDIGGWPYTTQLTPALDAAWRHHQAKGVKRTLGLQPRQG